MRRYLLLFLFLFFSFNVMAVTEVFYENKIFVAKLLLQSVENTGDGIRAFLIFDLKQNNFQQSVKFYTQYVEYQCNENLPIILEENLMSESNARKEKINNQRSLNVIREVVKISYNNLYGQICI
ncbi:MAG: hypothetical protein AAEA78_01395 [Methylophilaceae bacterium]